MSQDKTQKLIVFTMPKWGIEMAEGTIGEWMVLEGDSIAKGQTIVAIETDKISNEVEAEWDATMLRRVAGEGETIAVGGLVAVFGPKDTPAAAVDALIDAFVPADTAFEPGAEAPAKKAAALAAEAAPAPAAPAKPAFLLPEDTAISPKAREFAEARELAVEDVAGSGRHGRITLQDVEQLVRPASAPARKGLLESGESYEPGANATPLARREAARLNVALGEIEGSGKAGRIRRRDVLAKAPAAGGDNGPDIIKFSAMRRTMAKRLVESVNSIPHFYLRTEADIDWLLTLREKINREKGIKLTVNDFIVKAVANALMAVPDVNVHVFDNEIHRFPRADVAVAVSVEGGLLTPVLRAANAKSLIDIATETRDLADRARKGALLPEDYKGGTFTVSNLGMFGLTSFDAVINPPQGAILAVGAGRRLPRERNFALAFPTIMEMTLSCDHRAIDGALGARFLAALKTELEQPAGLMEGV